MLDADIAARFLPASDASDLAEAIGRVMLESKDGKVGIGGRNGAETADMIFLFHKLSGLFSSLSSDCYCPASPYCHPDSSRGKGRRLCCCSTMALAKDCWPRARQKLGRQVRATSTFAVCVLDKFGIPGRKHHSPG